MRRNKIIRIIATLMAMVMLISVLPLHIAVAAVSSAGTTSIKNGFIKVTVDNASGRFSIRTEDGQPIRKKDNGVDMIFGGDNPETSFTTFRINGTDLIFGNPYKMAPNWTSEVTPPKVVTGNDGTQSLLTVWTVQGIRISQVITLLLKEDKDQGGNARVQYVVENTTNAKVEIGSRVLLDTSVGGNDGPAFQIGQNYSVPLTVERKLVHEPEKLGYDKNVDEQAYNLHKLPPYWVMRDKLDLSNPLATNVIAYGFNNLFEGGINIVDEMVVGHWANLAGTKWEYEPDENLDFTQDTNDYGTADTAVAFYWEPDTVQAGAQHSYELVYGLGEIVSPEKVFDVRFLDPTQKLETNEEETGYVNDGVFEVNTEIENLEMFNTNHSQIDVTLTLEKGLSFVDENGKELNATSQKLTFRKDVPPEQAAQGIEFIPYKPGEVVAAKWRVKGTGKAWPSTRQYMVTVSSPETEKKLETAAQESEGLPESEIRAIYESSRAGFIFLPPVGELRETLVYAMSPEEAYSKDEKYITLNVSNIAAYNVGNEATSTAANFDMYLVNLKNGDRYKVPVTRSVTSQPLGNGFAGDLKLVYRGGEKVKADGTTLEVLNDAILPLGEYAVQVDYRDKSIPEMAEALSFKTDQTFAITENEENRVRKAGILAVYKTKLDLNAGAGEKATFASVLPWTYGNLTDAQFKTKLDQDRARLTAAKQEMVAASRKLDPALDVAGAIDASASPVYAVQTFENEAAFETFKKGLDDDTEQEVVLEVRGKIVQSGTGANAQYTVQSDTEPAILNKSVAYSGKDLTISTGNFPLAKDLRANTDTPFLQTLFVGGDGTLSVANSGFVFHSGEWTVDFYNGFDKSLGTESKLTDEEQAWEEGRNPEDPTLNGTLTWANGMLGDALNPYRNLLVSYVYFNKHTLFSTPTFSLNGFGLKLNDFVLRQDGVSFGGAMKMFIVNGEVSNVMFNQSGFVGIDSSLAFELDNRIGLFKPDSEDSVKGGINVTHYKDPNKYGVMNSYGVNFEAKLENLFSISAELAFKRVPDGRIIPDVIAFGSDLPDPGIMINPATKISSIRGAIRELAMTIAGGTERLPLTLEAGIDMELGQKPAVFSGSVDLTLKATGFKVVGKLGFGEGSKVIPMLTEALVQTQWASPMFIRARAQIDVGGWDIIVGSASLFIGENLEKGRVDFEGMVSSKIQIPSSVPVVGGLGFGTRAGVNNDELWAGISLLFLTLGIKYYWGGGISFLTDGSALDDEALAHLAINDPEQGPRLLQIGTGIETLATSWENEEPERYEIRYTAVGDGIDMIEDSSQNLGIGGIRTSNGGKTHVIPMSGVTGDALLELEYFTTTRPTLTLKRDDGSTYDIVYGEATDRNATAFEQIIKAPKEGDLKSDGTTVTKKEELQGTDIRRIYVAIPQEDAKTGSWTLTSSQSVKSKLMNIPVLPELSSTELAIDTQDADQFTATWTVDNASPGDTVDLYLSSDRLQATPTPDESIDPGIMIAKGIEIESADIGADGRASGEMTFDVKQIAYLGGVDLRGLLQQGTYYLRTELKTDMAFSVLSSQEGYTLVDPFAPNAVPVVETRSIGNGQFEVAFPAITKTAEEEAEEFTYILTASDEQGHLYDPFGEEGYSESELKTTLKDGKYHVTVGGWNALGTPKLGADGKVQRNADGTIAMEDKEVRHSGLEPGKSYRIGVTIARQPASDEQANLRLSTTTYSGSKLLPAPTGPVLSLDNKQVVNNKYEVITSSNQITVNVASNQPNVVVEASTDDGSLGTTNLVTTDKLKFNFEVDGVYAVQLKARNTNTGDTSVTMLYVTIDTTAPMIYLDSPSQGERAQGGVALVQGTTMTDAQVTVTDADSDQELAQFKPDENGVFKYEVPIDANRMKTRLRIKTEDAAGNVNSAVVEVLNDDFKLPRRLKLVMPEELVAGGEQATVQTYVEYTDGTRELADNDSITYSVVMGEANAAVQDDGLLDGKRVGAALIQADYTWQGTELSTTDIVSVVAPKTGAAPPDYMDTIKASTIGTGKKGETRVSISAAGHKGNMVGSELAYRIFTEQLQVMLPTFEQDISGWNTLPSDKVIKAKPGEWVVIAKRTTSEPKLTTASSAAVKVNERISSSVEPSAPSSGGSKPPASNVPVGPLTVGGVAIDSAVGGKDMKVPLELDAVQKDGLLLVDVTPGVSGPTVVAHPVREALLDAVKQGQRIRLHVAGQLEQLRFELDADLIKQLAAKDISMDLESDWGSYRLDWNAIDLNALEAAFPTQKAEDIKVSLNVGKPDQAYERLAAKLASEGRTIPRGTPVAFNMTASDGTKSIEIGKLLKMTTKELYLPEGEDERSVSTVVVLESDGSLRHVPTRFEVREGRMVAIASSLTNSVYLPIRYDTAFSDMKGHWASEAVHDLASRLVVNGVSSARYEPSRSMTRAELAALMVRAFGLKPDTGVSSPFADVKAADWYNDVVQTATAYGLMTGYSGNRFGPQDAMTREQVMVMLIRAYEMAGHTAPAVSSAASSLEGYTDASTLSDWAKDSAAQAVKLGLIQGKSATTLEPKAPVTRAEMATLVRRLVVELDLL